MNYRILFIFIPAFFIPNIAFSLPCETPTDFTQSGFDFEIAATYHYSDYDSYYQAYIDFNYSPNDVAFTNYIVVAGDDWNLLAGLSPGIQISGKRLKISSVLYEYTVFMLCDSSPLCLDSEKLCEQLRLVDSNNIIKYASYVTYENRDAELGSTSSLEYRAPDFNDEDPYSYTSYMSIGNPELDCFCPDDSALPADLQNNFSVTPPGEAIAAPGVVDNFDCAQQCFPRGYIYSDGNCICVDDGAKTETASTPPGASTNESPANSPADPTDAAQQLGVVNENLGSVINQGNQSNEYLSNIADNLATSVNNQEGIVDGLGGLGDQLGNDIAGLGDKLDSIQDQQSQGYNLEGSADLPSDNEYDPVVDDVEEDSLSDAITQYLASGIPVLSYINGSGATIANASSSMDVVLWGDIVTFDLSPMASILDTMGYFLTAISMIVGFFIIVGRG